MLAKSIKGLPLKEMIKFLTKDNYALFNVAETVLKGGSASKALSPASGGSGGGVSGIIPGNNRDDDALKRYQSSTGKDILYNVLNTAGTGAETAGNIFGIKNDYFGKALLAAAQGLDSPASAQIYGSPFAAIMQLPALATMARGKVQQTLGQGMSTIAKDLGSDIRNIDRYNKNVAAMVEQAPPGQYYNQITQGDKLSHKR